MAKKNKGIDIEDMMDMLLGQLGAMDKKETLRHLSELIIPLMGWSGYHLNQFRKGDDLYTPAYQSKDNDMDGFCGCRQHASEEYIIADLT